MRFFGAHREAGTEILPSEGHLPPFEGATEWLNSEPLTARGTPRRRRRGAVLDLHLRQLAEDAALRA